MPYSSYGGIFICQWIHFRFTLPMGVTHPLSKSSFVKHVRAALEEAGLPAKDYAGHSFRIGATTIAATAGSAIQTLGQWESSAFKRYIRLDPKYLALTSSTLAQCQIKLSF